MWPFSRKLQYPGVKENPDGSIEFSLTEDEAREADTALYAFKGHVVHPDAAERVRNGSIAVALCRYAKDLVNKNCNDITDDQLRSNWSSIREVLMKAIAAVWKSYSLYELPIFLYHRATFLRLIGNKDEAFRMMSQFVEKQLGFKPDQIDDVLSKWEGTDVTHAVAVARDWEQRKLA